MKNGRARGRLLGGCKAVLQISEVNYVVGDSIYVLQYSIVSFMIYKPYKLNPLRYASSFQTCVKSIVHLS